jgi:hypothetical protein
MAAVQPPTAARKMTQSRIEIFDRADGGKEFVAPAMRNFQEKKGFLIVLLFLMAAFAIFVSVAGSFMSGLPFAWARFLAANFFFSFFVILTLPLALVAFVSADMWLRSTRIIAVPGELRVVTHWLFVRRTNVVPVSKIIGITADNNTTADGVCYYDITVLAKCDGKNWLAVALLYFQQPDKPERPLSEDELKLINSRKIRAITDIDGESDAKLILQEINRALGRCA